MVIWLLTCLTGDASDDGADAILNYFKGDEIAKQAMAKSIIKQKTSLEEKLQQLTKEEEGKVFEPSL